MKLRNYQKSFLTYWNEVLPFGILQWERRSGKTIVSLRHICEMSISNKNFISHVYLTGPSLAFARDEIVTIFSDLGQQHLIKQENAKLIGLVNGSVIRLFNIKQENTLRGMEVDLIYVDEFGFMKDKDFAELILYTKVYPKVKFLLSSTDYEKNKLKFLRDTIGFNNFFVHEYKA